eukprot:SAG25_NODE_34_length_20232_cov_4.725534_6_plen_165_part_00
MRGASGSRVCYLRWTLDHGHTHLALPREWGWWSWLVRGGAAAGGVRGEHREWQHHRWRMPSPRAAALLLAESGVLICGVLGSAFRLATTAMASGDGSGGGCFISAWLLLLLACCATALTLGPAAVTVPCPPVLQMHPRCAICSSQWWSCADAVCVAPHTSSLAG